VPPSLSANAAAAVQALQKWYVADPYAASTGLYHYTDPDFANEFSKSTAVSKSIAAVVKAAGYENAYVDANRWWNSANAITALIDYMEVTQDFSYLPVVERTFATAPNAFTINVGKAAAGGVAGFAAGAAAGATWGSSFGLPGAVLGGLFGGIVGAFGGGSAAAATFARVYFTNFRNGAYDDEGWWAMAWIRAYDITRDTKYLDQAAVIFSDMRGGWDSICEGGIYWHSDHKDSNGKGPYKNSIPNELFIAIGAALYLRYEKILPAGTPQLQGYLDWAYNNAWRWFSSRQGAGGLINAINLINDSFDATKTSYTCTNKGTTNVWTYNQGVILGALCDLFAITGESELIEQAHRTANALLINNVFRSQKISESGVHDGILTEFTDDHNPSADSSQFKGIFIRNLVKLWANTGRPERYKKFILQNAYSAIGTQNSDNQYGASWSVQYDTFDFARQTSAIDLLNAALAVQNSGPDTSYLGLLLGGDQRRDISYLYPLLLD
jgi:predicted alpha-1,6-mannanase (GH76 family)